MKYLTHSNRGSIIEQLMNNTSEYYREHKIAYFRKTNPLYVHISKKNKNSIQNLLDQQKNEMHIKFTHKGDLDYYGLYKGQYFSIELKETKKSVFSLTLIRENQFSQLKEIYHLGGISLVLIHFVHEKSSLWLITFPQLIQLKLIKKSKKFSPDELLKIKAFPIEIIYPHILNLQPVLEKLLSERTS